MCSILFIYPCLEIFIDATHTQLCIHNFFQFFIMDQIICSYHSWSIDFFSFLRLIELYFCNASYMLCIYIYIYIYIFTTAYAAFLFSVSVTICSMAGAIMCDSPKAYYILFWLEYITKKIMMNLSNDRIPRQVAISNHFLNKTLRI